MRISRIVCVGAAALLAAACVPGNSPLRITGINPIKDDCTVDTGIQVGAGSLDVSGLGTYLLSFHIVSELEMIIVTQDTNGTNLNQAGVNNFIEEEADFTYTSKNPIISFTAERIPFAGVVLAGQEQELQNVNMIGPNALQKLRDNVTDPTQVTTLSVTMTLKGHLESGQPESVNSITFPISVTNSNPATAGMCTSFVPAGPCSKAGVGSPGQDGSAVQCNSP